MPLMNKNFWQLFASANIIIFFSLLVHYWTLLFKITYIAVETLKKHQKMKFTIRTYDKHELAQLYFPDSDRDTALRHLRRWIIRCPD
ncbi:DUF4248 domain-containing protein, partial [Parabacteroides distasonis]